MADSNTDIDMLTALIAMPPAISIEFYSGWIWTDCFLEIPAKLSVIFLDERE